MAATPPTAWPFPLEFTSSANLFNWLLKILKISFTIHSFYKYPDLRAVVLYGYNFDFRQLL